MDEAAKMNKMVKQLLNLSALESGNDAPVVSTFDINELIRDFVNSAGILIQQNDAHVMFAQTEPLYVIADEFKIEEAHIEEIKQLISQIRNIRTNANVHPSKKSELIFITDDVEYEKLLKTSKLWVEKLGFSDKISIEKDEINVPKHAVSALANGIKVFIPFEELVDVEGERAKLQVEKERLEAEVARSTKMLSNPGFVNKAPEAKVQEEKEKMQKYKDMLADTITRLEQL